MHETSFERDGEFDNCVSEVESLICMIEGSVVEEREKEPVDQRKQRMDSLRSILVSGFAVISGLSIIDTETILGKVRRDRLETDICDENDDDTIDWQSIGETMESIRDKIGDLMDVIGDIGADDDPREVSEVDRRMLGKIQNTLGEADGLILAVMPPFDQEQAEAVCGDY